MYIKKQNTQRIRADLFMCACVCAFIVSVGQNVGVLYHSIPTYLRVIISSMTIPLDRYIRVFFIQLKFFSPLRPVDFFLVTL